MTSYGYISKDLSIIVIIRHEGWCRVVSVDYTWSNAAPVITTSSIGRFVIFITIWPRLQVTRYLLHSV